MKHLIPCLFATAASLSAGELAPNQIPASAKWILHTDIEAMRGSMTGMAVFSRIEADHGAKLRALKRMFSLHPLNDLRDVTLFGDGKPDHAVMLMDGTFDRAHIEDLVKGSTDYSASTHSGFTVHHWKDQDNGQHAAFATPDLIVFSRQEEALNEELDLLKANAPAATGNPALPEPGTKPLIAVGANLAEIELPQDAARVLRAARVLKLSAHEDGGRFSIRLGAETADAAKANRLRRMLDGIVALAEAGNADLSGSGFQCDITTTDKPGVNASVSLPVPEWLGLLQKAAEKATGKH